MGMLGQKRMVSKMSMVGMILEDGMWMASWRDLGICRCTGLCYCEYLVQEGGEKDDHV